MPISYVIKGLPVTQDQFNTYFKAKASIETLTGMDKQYAEHDLAGYMNDIQAAHILALEEAEAVNLSSEEHSDRT